MTLNVRNNWVVLEVDNIEHCYPLYQVQAIRGQFTDSHNIVEVEGRNSVQERWAVMHKYETKEEAQNTICYLREMTDLNRRNIF